MISAPTVAEVDRIAALDDPLIRNLQITQCYFELSTAVVERTGAAANWCTFATWASKQAGQTIRKDDLSQALTRALTRPTALNDLSPGQPATPNQGSAQAEAQHAAESLWQVLDPRSPFERASAAVARGNRKVFAEIGRIFAAFVTDCLPDRSYDAAKIAAFCASLRPGPPPDGQEILRRAFASYYTALFEPDADARAEQIFFANLAIGLHEQTRLQPEIVAALDAPVIDPHELARALVAQRFPLLGSLLWPWLALRRWLGRPLLVETLAQRSAERIRQLAHQIVTEHLMTITFPGGAYLRLGRDLRTPYPAALQQIDSGELQTLLAEIDPTPNSTTATGAVDWGDLSQRLHFIADMFRCFQENPLLLEQPFEMEQVGAIKAGMLPTGEL